MSSILEVEHLSAGYSTRRILEDVSFSVSEGEIFVIMGPSGCGKTTLLKTVVGLTPPLSGDVSFRGQSLSPPRSLESFRKRIGMVFQAGALLNSISVMENVALPLRQHRDMPEWMIRELVRIRLAQVGLLEARDLLPMELSGGMKKRAGIARALVLEPELLFFDEPTGGLDPITADGIDNLILALRDQLHVTIVAVTHELASIFKIGDRVMMLRDGRIAAMGTGREIEGSLDPAVESFVHRRAPKEGGAADRFLRDVEGGGS